MTHHLTFLHGWGMSPAVWAPLTSRLDTVNTLHTPALPGHGDHPGAAPTGDWATALAAELPDGGVLCGWSLGGQIALRIALQAPEKCARLILIGSSPCFVHRDDWPHGLDPTTVDAFRNGFATSPASVFKRFVALQTLGDAKRKELARTLNTALTPVSEHNAPILADGLAQLASSDLRDALPAIHCPVRIFHGDHDALMPVTAAEFMADTLPDARMSTFVDGGHAPFLSRPDECAALMQSFIDD